MDHVGDGQPPAEDARPYLPTDIERPYSPADDARPYLPTDIERPYLPTDIERPYLPTDIERPYLPTDIERPYLPTDIERPYLPTDIERPYLPTDIERPYSPADDARPYLPTDIERPYSPADDARPYLPTEIERPYPPMQAGPAYWPTHTGPGEPAVAGPSYTPTHARPAGQPTRAGRADPAPELLRSGPGVPATPPAGAGQTAERIWRTGRPDEPPRRPHRWRRLAGAALTVILLAASAVVLYLRFHPAPFHVTGVAITERMQSGCGVNVTGQISTNGAAGTVSYQWLFRPDRQAPQPLSQSVVAGQNAVYVTVAVQGSGHGSASRAVTLQILGPDRWAVSTSVVLRC